MIAPRVFLDMDGVLVDFIGGAARAHGIENPYDDHSNHGVYDIDTLIKMDRNKFWEPFGRKFWAKLDPTDECFGLVDILERKFGQKNICILSSPTANPESLSGKLDWLQKHLPQYARQFLFGTQKHFCAGRGALLIDDSESNVDKFELHSGRAILFPRPWNRNHIFTPTKATEYLIREIDEFHRSMLLPSSFASIRNR